MNKLLLIGIKDLKLMFRDRAALILILLAPFLLTLGMGLVTGRFSGGGNSGISDIPIVIVNLDKSRSKRVKTKYSSTKPIGIATMRRKVLTSALCKITRSEGQLMMVESF